MPRRRNLERLYRPIGEPSPGTLFVGYVRYSSVMQDGATITTQKRRIQEYADKKGWVIVRWYEEPAHSAKYDDIEKRTIFALMLEEAGVGFMGIIVYDNSRWARSDIVGPEALRRLRAKRVWWATADDKFTIDNVQESGPGIWHAIDTKLNAAFVFQLSKRVIDGKEERALEGWHQSRPPFGYLPPEYAPPPVGIGTNWRAPRAPVRPDPANWDALELIAQMRVGYHSAREIAIALNQAGYRTNGNRWFGPRDETQGPEASPRLFTDDTVRLMLINPFYREFAPGSGKGTIITPAGHRVQGHHEAAWMWDTWHKFDEVAATLYSAPRATSTVRAIYPFGGMIVCAGCGRPMRSTHTNKPDRKMLRYYQCSSPHRMLICEKTATTPAWRVEKAFGELLRRYRLGENWEDDLRALASSQPVEPEEDRGIQQQRLQQEQEAYNMMLLAKGIEHSRYLQETARIQAALAALDQTMPETAQHEIEREAAETLVALPDLWEAARSHEDLEALRELAVSLLQNKGLVWDSQLRTITAILPHEEYLPSLRVALTSWEWDGTFLRAQALEILPQSQRPIVRDKRTKTAIRREVPPQRYALTAQQQGEALRLLEEGLTIRDVAKRFGVSHSAVWRLVHRG